MTKILYTVATDKDGKLIKANDAKKGDDFFCPLCKTGVILRKSGKIGKGAKRPHFAHNVLTPNCTPETALHYSFKNLLADKLKQYIVKQTPLLMTWQCEYCHREHDGNLLKKIKTVKVEHNLTVFRPDITLYDGEDKVIAVIEVVVTHKPEERALKFYSDNNIILIQINLSSDEDLDKLEDKIAYPDIVAYCPNPKCQLCGHFQHKITMTVVDGTCWNCHSTMKIAIVEDGMGRSGSFSDADEFTPQEITFAKSKGAIIQAHYSNRANKKYLANTCPKCGRFIGKFYLISKYLQPALREQLPSVTYDIGYHCEHCTKVPSLI